MRLATKRIYDETILPQYSTSQHDIAPGDRGDVTTGSRQRDVDIALCATHNVTKSHRNIAPTCAAVIGLGWSLHLRKAELQLYS